MFFLWKLAGVFIRAETFIRIATVFINRKSGGVLHPNFILMADAMLVSCIT